MPLNDRDLAFFIDILECIRDIKDFTSGISYYDFEKDKIRKLAVERQLEVIGQAANKISKETQRLFQSIPWQYIIGLRNKLAHDYGEILVKRIWDITRKPIDDLYQALLEIEELKNYLESQGKEKT